LYSTKRMLLQLVKSGRTNPVIVIAMRESGASLDQIAAAVGRTKERIRQILIKTTGSTRHRLLSTNQLYQLINLPRSRIIGLYKDGVIKPKAEWTTGNHHYLLWPSNVAETITNYYNKKNICKICGQPLPKGRWVYCTASCYNEGQKYKNKSYEAKQKHLKNIKEYLERRREIAYVAAS
jgi:hypothetical protein